MTNDSLNGEELADMLLPGMRNGHMRAAIRLLATAGDGYWLRRLLDDRKLNAASDVPLIDRNKRPPQVQWDALERLLKRNPHAFDTPRSDIAVLKVALSLVGPWTRSPNSTPRAAVVRKGSGDIETRTSAPAQRRQRNPKRYTGPRLPRRR